MSAATSPLRAAPTSWTQSVDRTGLLMSSLLINVLRGTDLESRAHEGRVHRGRI